MRYKMKSLTAVYYFRVCAKEEWAKTKSSSNYEVCGGGGGCVYKLKVKDAITLGGTAGCGVEVDG